MSKWDKNMLNGVNMDQNGSTPTKTGVETDQKGQKRNIKGSKNY